MRRSTRTERRQARLGAVLLLVAGICSILASLAFAFLVRNRSDALDVVEQLRDTQARLMLTAACNYVQEAGRLGYDWTTPPATDADIHREAYGWIDVRDGRDGPRGTNGEALFSTALVVDGDGDGTMDRPAWPAIGGVVRAPMHVQRRPPFALAPDVAPNAMVVDELDPDFGRPLLRRPDPEPAIDDRARWWAGDPAPRQETVGLAWFRILRDGPSTFVVTCGAGATQGFRDWQECDRDGHGQDYGGDPALFADAIAQEARLWYRIEWSGAVKDASYHDIQNEYPHFGLKDHYALWPMNSSDSHQCQAHTRGMVGTMRWVQRLREEPARW